MSRYESVGVALQGSGHLMQDTWGSYEAFAWVLDGATRLNAEQNLMAARWVADLGEAIRAFAMARPDGLALPELLASAIDAAKLDVREHPSATVAMARFSSAGLETLVLGDAAVFAGECLIQDSRLQHVAADIRQARREAKRLGQTDRVEELHRELLVAEAQSRNVSGGFWVASDNPYAAHEALFKTFVDVQQVLLMSDGVADEGEHWKHDQYRQGKSSGRELHDLLKGLRGKVISRDGCVDDMVLVRHSWIS